MRCGNTRSTYPTTWLICRARDLRFDPSRGGSDLLTHPLDLGCGKVGERRGTDRHRDDPVLIEDRSGNGGDAVRTVFRQLCVQDVDHREVGERAGKPRGNGVGFSIAPERAQRRVHPDVFAAEPFDGVSTFSNLVEYGADSPRERRGRFTDALQPGTLRAGGAPRDVIAAKRGDQGHAQSAVDSHSGPGLAGAVENDEGVGVAACQKHLCRRGFGGLLQDSVKDPVAGRLGK